MVGFKTLGAAQVGVSALWMTKEEAHKDRQMSRKAFFDKFSIFLSSFLKYYMQIFKDDLYTLATTNKNNGCGYFELRNAKFLPKGRIWSILNEFQGIFQRKTLLGDANWLIILESWLSVNTILQA